MAFAAFKLKFQNYQKKEFGWVGNLHTFLSPTMEVLYELLAPPWGIFQGGMNMLAIDWVEYSADQLFAMTSLLAC